MKFMHASPTGCPMFSQELKKGLSKKTTPQKKSIQWPSYAKSSINNQFETDTHYVKTCISQNA